MSCTRRQSTQRPKCFISESNSLLELTHSLTICSAASNNGGRKAVACTIFAGLSHARRTLPLNSKAQHSLNMIHVTLRAHILHLTSSYLSSVRCELVPPISIRARGAPPHLSMYVLVPPIGIRARGPPPYILCAHTHLTSSYLSSVRCELVPPISIRARGAPPHLSMYVLVPPIGIRARGPPPYILRAHILHLTSSCGGTSAMLTKPACCRKQSSKSSILTCQPAASRLSLSSCSAASAMVTSSL